MISDNLLKRIVDLILSMVLIILFFPVQIVHVLAIIIILKENPIFSQTRGLTLTKYRFTMFKFRTINSAQAEKQSKSCSKERFLIPNHEIKFGRFTEWIRRSGLDELPQLYNVLLGHMSLIGPRPLMNSDLQILKSEFPIHNDLRENIVSKPGITGIWQLYGNRRLGAENLIALDLFYEESKSFRMGLNILYSTILVILFARNSDAIVSKTNSVNLNYSLPLNRFKFLKKHRSFLQKYNLNESSHYSIKLPGDWWNVSDSYTAKNGIKLKLFSIPESKELNQKKI